MIRVAFVVDCSWIDDRIWWNLFVEKEFEAIPPSLGLKFYYIYILIHIYIYIYRYYLYLFDRIFSTDTIILIYSVPKRNLRINSF